MLSRMIYTIVRTRQIMNNWTRALIADWPQDKILKARVGIHFMGYFAGLNAIAIMFHEYTLARIDPDTGQKYYIDWSQYGKQKCDRIIRYDINIGKESSIKKTDYIKGEDPEKDAQFQAESLALIRGGRRLRPLPEDLDPDAILPKDGSGVFC